MMLLWLLTGASGMGASPVRLEVISFDREAEFEYVIGEDLSIMLQGIAKVKYWVSVDGLEVHIEQSPDLMNWVYEPPLLLETLPSEDGCRVYLVTLQILLHPESGADSLQHFRAQY